MPRWRKPYLEFPWAPPPPTPLPPAKSVDQGVSGLETIVAEEMPKTPELTRADSDRPSIADSETTLVGDTLADSKQSKDPLESNRSARSFGLIQSFCSFISDPGNPLVSF